MFMLYKHDEDRLLFPQFFVTSDFFNFLGSAALCWIFLGGIRSIGAQYVNGPVRHAARATDVRDVLTMKQRSFGPGTSLSVLGIGCGRVGSISNPVPMREIEAMLEAAVAAGVNLFDTADIYGQGDSERTLARLSRRHPGKVFIVTKVGGRHGKYEPLVRLAKPLLRRLTQARPEVRNATVSVRTPAVVHEFKPEALSLAIDGSRRRLGLDRLQGLLLHSPGAKALRTTEIGDFLASVVASGRAEHVGVSVDTVDALEAAVAIPAVSMIQAPIDVCDTLPGTAALRAIQDRRIAVFAREILRRSGPEHTGGADPRQAFADAIAPAFVTSALVGLSTRAHLRSLLTDSP